MVVSLFITACGGNGDDDSASVISKMVPSAVAPGIDATTLMAEIKILSSDEFGGRAPGSPGEILTIAYLTEQFSDLGLAPGNPDGSWVQGVPLVGITPLAGSEFQVTMDGDSRELEPGRDYVAWTKHVVDQVEINAEFVFVGYGAVAPEYEWDDFGDVDVRGKILIFLVNDPPHDDIFGGSAMTYYGRWTYKHEVAAELGAAGSFVIHEEGPAGYPWEVVGSSPYSESFDLVAADENRSRATVEGWIQRTTAEELFAMADLEFDVAKQQAATRGFQPIPLGITGTTRIENELRRIDSQNFVAKIEGSTAPDEYVLYVAHWDHLGLNPNLTGDQIFNGALDNASGTAGLIEIARAFSMPSSAVPRRSVLFLGVTAEEQGLLGSKHYSENPLYPAAQTVAAINMDGLNQWGRTHDLTVVGMGQSALDQVAAEVAVPLGRVLTPDPEPEKGFYYRSDHFSFAKAGIPAFYADGGVSYIDQPEGYGLAKREEYTANDYHAVSDEIKADWDLSGAVEDLIFFFRFGAYLAESSEWPTWSETSEFRAIRETQRPSSTN